MNPRSKFGWETKNSTHSSSAWKFWVQFGGDGDQTHRSEQLSPKPRTLLIQVTRTWWLCPRRGLTEMLIPGRDKLGASHRRITLGLKPPRHPQVMCAPWRVLSSAFVTPWLQHARPPCPSPTPGVYSNSCPSSRWCHPTISSSIVPFSSCLQSFPASGSFQMSQSFASGGRSIGVSASTSVLLVYIQDWFPLGLTGLISLLFQGLLRVLSKAIVQKHQFFGAQPSLWSSSQIHTWYWKNHSFDYMDLCWQSNVSAF